MTTVVIGGDEATSVLIDHVDWFWVHNALTHAQRVREEVLSERLRRFSTAAAEKLDRQNPGRRVADALIADLEAVMQHIDELDAQIKIAATLRYRAEHAEPVAPAAAGGGAT